MTYKDFKLAWRSIVKKKVPTQPVILTPKQMDALANMDEKIVAPKHDGKFMIGPPYPGKKKNKMEEDAIVNVFAVIRTAYEVSEGHEDDGCAACNVRHRQSGKSLYAMTQAAKQWHRSK